MLLENWWLNLDKKIFEFWWKSAKLGAKIRIFGFGYKINVSSKNIYIVFDWRKGKMPCSTPFPSVPLFWPLREMGFSHPTRVHVKIIDGVDCSLCEHFPVDAGFCVNDVMRIRLLNYLKFILSPPEKFFSLLICPKKGHFSLE